MAQLFEEHGLEVYLSSLSSQLIRSKDLFVAYVHWRLIQSGHKCVGKGEDFVANVHASELMPIGWNANEYEYALKYINANGKPYLLKVIIMDDTAFLAFQHAEGAQECLSTQVELDKLLVCIDQFSNDEKRREAVYSFLSNSSLRSSLSSEIAVLSRLTDETANQRSPSNAPASISKGGVPSATRATDRGLSSISGFEAIPAPPVLSPYDYGRSDLVPFSYQPDVTGSGMYFDPFRGRSAARPAIPGVPPRARYDPVAPDLSRFDPDPSSLRGPLGARSNFSGFERKPRFDDIA